jgi:alpha-beta hydrolase superfamily lysophospholipase
MYKEFTFASVDKKDIQAYCWLPENGIKYVVQIAHGMAEHATRYDHFAKFLNQHGIAVYANDHRGHGKTAGNLENRGFFAEKNGWMLCKEDLHELSLIIKKENPSVPLILLGHSMGSFLSRTYLAFYGKELNACILSGTASHPALLLAAGSMIAGLQSFFMGKKHLSKLLDKMSFGAYNKKIPAARTAFDWLSRDNEIVDRYVADDYCGFVCSSGFFHDLFSGLKFINKQKNIDKTPSSLPLLFIAGGEDPVGDYTKGVEMAVNRFKKAGVKNITYNVYPGCRHEILNEINKEEVYADLLKWIEELKMDN